VEIRFELSTTAVGGLTQLSGKRIMNTACQHPASWIADDHPLFRPIACGGRFARRRDIGEIDSKQDRSTSSPRLLEQDFEVDLDLDLLDLTMRVSADSTA